MTIKNLLLLPLAFLCVGCISVEVQQNIRADGTGNFAMVMDMSGMIEFMEEVAQESGETLSKADRADFEREIATACDSPEIKNVDLDEINAEMDSALNVKILSLTCQYLGDYALEYGATFTLADSQAFVVTALPNGNTQYRFTSTNEQLAGAYNFDDLGMNPDEFSQYMTASFTMTMPGAITRATAGDISGNTLTIDNLFAVTDLTSFEVVSVARGTTSRSVAQPSSEVQADWKTRSHQRICDRFFAADLTEPVRNRKLARLEKHLGIICQ